MFFLTIALLVTVTNAIEPLTAGLAGAAALASGLLYGKTHCRYTSERCDEYSIISNISGFESNIREHVHGQPLVQDVLVNALKAHFSTKQPAKALVLSFHGTHGSGKKYVSKFIAEALYKLGMRSKYFHQYYGGLHFSDVTKVDLYKINLQDEIRKIVSDCERSMFVFSDVHIMPPKLLDTIKQFFDYHEHVQGVDYRKTIFIFLSNTGAGLITKRSLELWKEGRKREDINLLDFESIIRAGALNEQGGLYMSDHVASNLIDYYIPFLPLEEKHVRLCIRDEFLLWGYKSVPDNAMKSILETLVFGPKEEKIFSTSGCKIVYARVGTYVQGIKFNF